MSIRAAIAVIVMSGAACWRAREIYPIVSSDEFAERFELAERGKDFVLYSEARLKRVR